MLQSIVLHNLIPGKYIWQVLDNNNILHVSSSNNMQFDSIKSANNDLVNKLCRFYKPKSISIIYLSPNKKHIVCYELDKNKEDCPVVNSAKWTNNYYIRIPNLFIVFLFFASIFLNILFYFLFI